MKFVVAVVRQATCSRRQLFRLKASDLEEEENADGKIYWVVSYNHKVFVLKDTLKSKECLSNLMFNITIIAQHVRMHVLGESSDRQCLSNAETVE